MFLYFRRRSRLKKISLEHRSLPTTRSALLDDEDAFDLAGCRTSAGPQLLPLRGLQTGSIFHEGVWPPPSDRSRLEDPLLAGSAVNLHSIVDDVMGGDDRHGRSISADTTRSDVPLLANMSPERGGDAASHMTSRPGFSPPQRFSGTSEPSETTPLNLSGHERQLSDDASPGFYASEGQPSRPAAPAPVGRDKSGRSAVSVSTTGSPTSDFVRLRGGPSGFGSLVVVNSTPPEAEHPLVTLSPVSEHPPHEIPPLYHTIERDPSDT